MLRRVDELHDSSCRADAGRIAETRSNARWNKPNTIEMHNQDTMSSSQIPSPRGAQEQTPDAGHVYGPVPVHPIGGYSWNADELPGVRRSSSIQSPYGNTPSPSLPSNELVFVPNTISYGASDIGSSASALTRFNVNQCKLVLCFSKSSSHDLPYKHV